MYKTLSNEQLLSKWKEKKESMMGGQYSRRDVDELFALRKELARRKGEKNPSASVNFSEDYLTD